MSDLNEQVNKLLEQVAALQVENHELHELIYYEAIWMYVIRRASQQKLGNEHGKRYYETK